MKRLIAEIHRRSLWQVLGIYVVASWVVLQVVEVLQAVMPLPEWFAGLAVGLLLIGLPIVLATAFIQQGTPAQAPPPVSPPPAIVCVLAPRPGVGQIEELSIGGGRMVGPRPSGGAPGNEE